MEKKTKPKAKSAVEIIPNKLFWICDNKPPYSNKEAYYFCIDDELIYQPFFDDFGPLNLGQTHIFCSELHKLIISPEYKEAKIYQYCADIYNKKSNGAYLMGAYQVLMLGKTAKDSMHPFAGESFVDFRDATMGPCAFKCTIEHCLEGLEYAKKLGWYNPGSFSIKDYEHYEKIENGDINWIIPGHMLAFSTPVDSNNPGELSLNPEFYSPILKKLGVSLIVRLTQKEYDREKFIKYGFKHIDLYFTDGKPPPDSILRSFLRECEAQKGAIAVHCKAGLGRTGTLISCYAIKNFKIPAAAMIAWTRICRPGSVLGPQQAYLLSKEAELLAEKSIFGKTIDPNLLKKLQALSVADKRTDMSEHDNKVLKAGDVGQGDRLVSKKKVSKQSSNAHFFLID